MRRARISVILGAIVLGVASWLAVLFLSRPASSSVKVSILSVTNDSSGLRHSTFRIANQGKRQVVIMPVYSLQNRQAGWRSNDLPQNAVAEGTNMMGILPFHPQTRLLPPGRAYEVTLTLPFDSSGWRACFWPLEPERPLPAFLKSCLKQVGFGEKDKPQALLETGWME